MTETVTDQIKRGEFKRIIVFTGVSGAHTGRVNPLSAGINMSDYRLDLFSELTHQLNDPSRKKNSFTTPEQFLTRSYVTKRKVFKYEIYLNYVDECSSALPASSHRLCKWLYDEGFLVRVYTQNIDGLHQKAGLPEDMVVEYHGSLIKNTVVLRGDPVDMANINQTRIDFTDNSIDLVLILGTSLKVAPFSALVTRAPYASTRVLVDNDADHVVGKRWSVVGLNTRLSPGRESSERKQKYFFINRDPDSWAGSVMGDDLMDGCH